MKKEVETDAVKMAINACVAASPLATDEQIVKLVEDRFPGFFALREPMRQAGFHIAVRGSSRSRQVGAGAAGIYEGAAAAGRGVRASTQAGHAGGIHERSRAAAAEVNRALRKRVEDEITCPFCGSEIEIRRITMRM